MVRPIVLRVALAAALVAVVVIAGVAMSAPPRARWFGSQTAAGLSASSAPPVAFTGWSNPAGVGKPYGDKVQGLLTFRGNPTRTYYGTGPLPRTTPTRRWQFPQSGGLCHLSSDKGETKEWCGNGWTGQPAVFERDGRTWVVF